MPSLRPYQIEGSRRLQALPVGILGDDMGLGKCAVAIDMLRAINAPCALIVGPSVAKGVWRRELNKWGSHLQPTILSGRGSFRWPRTKIRQCSKCFGSLDFQVRKERGEASFDALPLVENPAVLRTGRDDDGALIERSHSVRGETAERKKPLYKPEVGIIHANDPSLPGLHNGCTNRALAVQDSGEIGYVGSLIGDDEIRGVSISGRGGEPAGGHSFFEEVTPQSDSRSSGGVGSSGEDHASGHSNVTFGDLSSCCHAPIIARGEAIICNFDILPVSRRGLQRLKEAGRPVDPSLGIPPNPPAGMIVIGDEAHYCKSNKAERTQAMRGICREAVKNGGRVYALTGTPIKKTPVDLYHILDTFQILPYTFFNYPTFVKDMGGVGSGRDLLWFGPSDKAKRILDKYMIRRTQAEVLPEIPPLTHSEIHVELSSVDKREVERIIAAAGWTVQDITPETFHQFLSNEHMMRARACLASAKVPAAMEWCDEAEACDEPVIVFSQHREAVKKIGSRKGWAIIDGDTPSASRSNIEDAFQAGKLKGIAANGNAGGVAITLTRARMLLQIDKAWSPADNKQIVGRVFRYGQERPVTAYSMVADHPLDERIAEILEINERDAEAILGDLKRNREKEIDAIFDAI